jgi:hypothetical protein
MIAYDDLTNDERAEYEAAAEDGRWAAWDSALEEGVGVIFP